MAREHEIPESATKRQKVDDSKPLPKNTVSPGEIKALIQNKKLAIGAKDVIKTLSEASIVFLVACD